MTTGVLCAVRGATETAVVRGLGVTAGDLEVTRRCADLAELLAAAAAGHGRVAVVSADLPGMDREAVRHLQGSGVRVVLLADDRAGWSAERARGLGADAVLEAAAAETDVRQAVTEALGGPPPEPPVGVRPGTDAADEALAGIAGRLGGERESGPPHGRGAVVAVWGPTGAPGRTTVAVGLAAELAAGARGEALLVDADTYGGTVAQVLGMLDEAPGLAAATRAAATGRLDVATLALLTPAVGPGLRVLTGISRPDRWTEVGGGGLDLVWQAARELAAWTVVDCGFCLELDEVLSYDTRAPRRNGATLSALAEADVVVVVGGGDPIGLQRLVRGLTELTEVGVPPARRVVVVNRVRASASGPRPAEAIRAALHRYAGLESVRLVPEDREIDAAVLAGRTLREQAPGSAARRALAGVADQVTTILAEVGAPA